MTRPRPSKFFIALAKRFYGRNGTFIDFSLSNDCIRRCEVIDYPKVVLIIIKPSPFKKKQVFNPACPLGPDIP